LGYPLSESLAQAALDRRLTIHPSECAYPVLLSSGKHHYTIYAFIDLIAEDHEFQDGKPVTTLNLKVDHFESLRCHLLGVTMAPVIFPRSNDFVITVDRFQTLLRQASPP
jgi:hypothetical protein